MPAYSGQFLIARSLVDWITSFTVIKTSGRSFNLYQLGNCQQAIHVFSAVWSDSAYKRNGCVQQQGCTDLSKIGLSILPSSSPSPPFPFAAIHTLKSPRRSGDRHTVSVHSAVKIGLRWVMTKRSALLHKRQHNDIFRYYIAYRALR